MITTAVKAYKDDILYYTHFGINSVTARVWGNKPSDVIKVRMMIAPDQTESEPPDYWGWWSYTDKRFHMIWPSKAQFSICFPYGYKANEKRGEGKAYRLIVIKEEL